MIIRLMGVSENFESFYRRIYEACRTKHNLYNKFFEDYIFPVDIFL